jgi:hypothetical protein
MGADTQTMCGRTLLPSLNRMTTSLTVGLIAEPTTQRGTPFSG